MTEYIDPPALPPKKSFASRCPRFLCLQVLFLLLISFAWWTSQVLPVYVSTVQKEPDLFYGIPHKATSSALFGKVTLRINNDDDAKFLLWLNQSNKQSFRQLVDLNVPVELVGLRSWNNTWVVIGLSTAEGQLDYQGMVDQTWNMAMWSTIAATLSLATFAFVLRYYFKNKHHMKWF